MKHLIKKILRETVERYHALQSKYNNIPPDVLNHLILMDPTTKRENGEVKYVGPYVNWIIKQYLQDQSIVDDAGRISKALTIFDRYKNKMAVKDINQIKTVRDLIAQSTTVQVDDPTSTKAQRKQKVLQEKIKKIHETENWLLLSPQTKEASIALAGPPLTKWCTSSIGDETSPNLFDTYSKMNPLIVFCNKRLLIPAGMKNAGMPRPQFQFHAFEAYNNQHKIKTVGYEFQDANKNNYPLIDFMMVFPDTQMWFAEYFESCADQILSEPQEFDYFYDKFFNPIFNKVRFG